MMKMTGNSSSHDSPSATSSMVTVRGIILTVGVVTLLCFSILSVRSLRSPLQLLSSSFNPLSPCTDCSPPIPSVSKNDDQSTRIYFNSEIFKMNYEEMEKKFKVYIYPDGDNSTFYHTPHKLAGKYASEGYFFQNIQESRFYTEDPEQADMFFIPISCYRMRLKGYKYRKMSETVSDYVQLLSEKYPYWNRTMGADHFFVVCQDVGVRATEGLPFLMKNSIRIVCSPSYEQGYVPHKDISLPHISMPFSLPARANDVQNRTTLGFWAGHRNSDIRNLLSDLWHNDTELDIATDHVNNTGDPYEYENRFFRAKFCICPGGNQVNSPRIADAIHYGCVPVILADFYDLPFNDVIDWRKIAVVLKYRDVYQLKQILKAIPDDEYVKLHDNLAKARKHFVWNSPPIKYDAFHMVMYELWLRHSVVRY